jgi:hypothetical protein
MSSVLLRALSVLAAALLCGCQVTVVENLPEGADATCPAGWAGAWIGIDERGRDDPDFGVHVDAACVLSVTGADPKDAPPAVTLHPKFLASGDAGVMLLERSEVAQLLEWKPDDPSAPPAGWVPMHYNRDGDQIALESPDHRRIATLIVNGGIEGAVHWSSSDSGYNVVEGDAAAILARLRDSGFFERDDPALLRRVGNDRRALDRALRQAQRDEERRARTKR